MKIQADIQRTDAMLLSMGGAGAGAGAKSAAKGGTAAGAGAGAAAGGIWTIAAPLIASWFLHDFLDPMSERKIKEAFGKGLAGEKMGLMDRLGLEFWSTLTPQYAAAEFVTLAKKAAKESAKIEKDFELAEQHANKTFKNIELAGKKMNELLKTSKGAGTYDPADINMGVLARFQKKIKSTIAHPKLAGTREAAMGENALNALASAEGLILKAARGEATPNELVTVMEALGDAGAYGTHINKLFGSAAMGGTLLKKFQEDVIKETAKLGTAGGVDYTARLSRLSGGEAMTPYGTHVPRAAIPGGVTGTISGGPGIDIPVPWAALPESKALYDRPPSPFQIDPMKSYMGGAGSTPHGKLEFPTPQQAAAMSKRLAAQTPPKELPLPSPQMAAEITRRLASLDQQRDKQRAKTTGTAVDRALRRAPLKVQIVGTKDPMGPLASLVNQE
jgi:hypothetical protein